MRKPNIRMTACIVTIISSIGTISLGRTRIYRTLTPIALPQSLPETQHPALHNLTPAETVSDPLRLPTLADLTYVLFYTAGVTKRRVLPGYGEMLFRAAACTGALYHIELYIAVAELPDLPAGVYHFSPVDFALRCLRQGDFRQALVEASAHAAELVTTPVIIVGSDTFWRNAWKYRARAYRHSFWDAGTMLANLFAAATRVPSQHGWSWGFAIPW